MKAHLQLVLWAFQVLWGCKAISAMDRFRLYRKSLNLYLSYLAFTDQERPHNQSKQAMISALLSAIYDYDTDWTKGDRYGSNIFTLLDQHVESDGLKKVATELFHSETEKTLSPNESERGSVALIFFRNLINSDWMRKYSDDDLEIFGRKLQIIDDLLDLERDYEAGDTNCFLIEGGERAKEFALEAEEFLSSDFFKELKKNSKMYRILERKIRKKINQFGIHGIRLKNVISAGRPITGAYAFLLTIIGFRLGGEARSLECGLAATIFAFVTMSIMIFNDYIDRNHDRKKGKLAVSENPKKFLYYWCGLNILTLAVLAGLIWLNIWAALFCMLVWIVGICYSFIPNWYLVQNLIVAACSASPVLCGYRKDSNLASIIIIFLLFASLIYISEIYKDTKDRVIDKGYKETMPVRLGHKRTFSRIILAQFIPAALMLMLFTIHGNRAIMWLMLTTMPLLAFQQATTLLHPELIRRPITTLRGIIVILLIVILFT
jgi:4-hydroxybenzoate polyprenyltransferase